MKAIYGLPKAPALTTSVNNMMSENQMSASALLRQPKLRTL
jgi:hypothetical protein